MHAEVTIEDDVFRLSNGKSVKGSQVEWHDGPLGMQWATVLVQKKPEKFDLLQRKKPS